MREDELQLLRLAKVKHREHKQMPKLGDSMVSFFKKEVQKRQTKMTQIAGAWNALIPPELSEHCCLDSFSAGSLKILVDNSAHLYQLKQLLLGGVEKQLKLTCVGLKKVSLKPGRWYVGDGVERKITF
jgi:hypothetical protein